VAVLRAEFVADPGEGGREAGAVVGQHVGEAEGEGGGGFSQERDGALLGLVVLDGQVDGAGAPVDGDVQIALAPLAIGGSQLRQVLDADVHEAEVVVLEGALAPPGLVRGGRRPPAQPLGAEDAPDAVAVEVRQEMGDHEGQVVEGEVGGAAERHLRTVSVLTPKRRASTPLGSSERAISARTTGVVRALGWICNMAQPPPCAEARRRWKR
jgi:hypothetical protein